MSSTSKGDGSPPQDEKYFEWLVSKNNDLTADNKRLHTQLTEWKQNATENKERLNRIYQNRNQTNYVDPFYDQCYRKLINNLTEQNVKLKSELCIKDISQLSELRTENEQLRGDLDERNLRIKDLEHDIKALSLPETVNELYIEIEQLRIENSKQKVRFSNVRNRLNMQLDIGAYVRAEFTKQRKEFIKLFSEHFLENHTVFIEQLKSLDINKNVPAFLFEPLRADVYTSTHEDSLDTHVVKPLDTHVVESLDTHVVESPDTHVVNSRFTVKSVSKDPNKDSGVDTLPDEFREIMRLNHMKELNDATKRIEELEMLLLSKDEVSRHLEMSVNKLISEKKVLENECRQLQTQLADTMEGNEEFQRLVDDAYREAEKYRNEAKSRQSIIDNWLKQQGGNQQVEQSMISSQLAIKARGPELMEPHQFAEQHHKQMFSKAVLVRDSPSKIDQQSHNPTETQDSSAKYLARGPSPPRVAAAPPIPARSKSCDDRKVASESFASSRRPQATSFDDSILCSNCNQLIAAEKFGYHDMHCKKFTTN